MNSELSTGRLAMLALDRTLVVEAENFPGVGAEDVSGLCSSAFGSFLRRQSRIGPSLNIMTPCAGQQSEPENQVQDLSITHKQRLAMKT